MKFKVNKDACFELTHWSDGQDAHHLMCDLNLSYANCVTVRILFFSCNLKKKMLKKKRTGLLNKKPNISIQL